MDIFKTTLISLTGFLTISLNVLQDSIQILIGILTIGYVSLKIRVLIKDEIKQRKNKK